MRAEDDLGAVLGGEVEEPGQGARVLEALGLFDLGELTGLVDVRVRPSTPPSRTPRKLSIVTPVIMRAV
jgi:hypothetical protein